jgi:hypothetical protein
MVQVGFSPHSSFVFSSFRIFVMEFELPQVVQLQEPRLLLFQASSGRCNVSSLQCNAHTARNSVQCNSGGVGATMQRRYERTREA